jgi:hypothetical protein
LNFIRLATSLASPDALELGDDDALDDALLLVEVSSLLLAAVTCFLDFFFPLLSLCL